MEACNRLSLSLTGAAVPDASFCWQLHTMMTNCAGMWLGLVTWTWDFEKAGLEHHPSSTAGPSGLGTLGQEALATQRTERPAQAACSTLMHLVNLPACGC